MLSTPPGTEMFQFPGFASPTYAFSRGSPGFARRGFPIRKSTDTLASSKPWLIAGSYVLHRLSVPRHPPHALNSLVKKTIDQVALKRATRIVSFKDTARCIICLSTTLAFNCQRSHRSAELTNTTKLFTSKLRALSKLSIGRFRSTPNKWWR